MSERIDPREEMPKDITSIALPNLGEMISTELLQEFQDTFAQVAGVVVVIRDAEGKCATRPSRPTRFSTRLAELLLADPKYEETSAALAKKAMESGRLERTRAGRGFLRFAAPVTIQGRAAAALVVDGVLDDKVPDDEIAALARELKVRPEELRRRTVQEMSLAVSFLQFAANSLADLCHEGWVIRRHVEELGTLLKVSELLSSARHVDDVLRLIVRTVVETLDVKACGLRLMDPKSGELVLKASHGLSAEYLGKGPVPIKRSEIDQAAMEGEPVYIRDIGKDPRILYPAEMLREGLRSNLVVGLRVRGKPIGALRIYSEEKRIFHKSEIALTQAIANLSAVAIESAQLYEEALEKDRLEYELGLAAQIQAHLLPETCPDLEGFDLCALNEPCRQVGGDFYDFIPETGGRRLGVVIADVCGKSMGGALLMATARSALRVQCEHCTTPAEIVTRVNMSLCRDTRPEEFVTLLFAKIDPKTRVFHFSNAGHSRPLLFRGDEVLALEGSGMVAGVLSDNTYHETDVPLQSGDVMFLYTDGLDEARNVEQQLFGLERATRIIRENRAKPACEIVAAIKDAVDTFTAGRDRSDDLTLIVIKVR